MQVELKGTLKKESSKVISIIYTIYYSIKVILAYPFPLCPVSVPPPGAVKD